MKKQTNEQKVLKALKDHGSMTQAELAKTTKVKNVYQLIANMVKNGKVRKDDKAISIAVDETSNLDPKKVSKTIYEASKKPHPALKYFDEERERLADVIDVRLQEYMYVAEQIKILSKLDSET